MTAQMTADLVEALESAARSALETMCFYGVLGRASDPGPEGDAESVSLTFHGDACGVMRLDVSTEALTEITSNFFGEEIAGVEPRRAEAVACELANIVCGAALSLWQPEGHFELTQPAPVLANAPRTGEPTIHLPLDLENGKLVVSVWVH